MRLKQGGFTLMELLAALTILGILAAIAIPNYTAYINRGKRAAVKADLMAAAAQLERNYTTNGCYNFTTAAECRAGAGTAPALPTTSPSEGRAHHAITVESTGQAFKLIATPCGTTGAPCPAGSELFSDSDCGVVTLAHTGRRGALVPAVFPIPSGDPDYADEALVVRCWRR
jgi:type IV pilus assembly protein PilE